LLDEAHRPPLIMSTLLDSALLTHCPHKRQIQASPIDSILTSTSCRLQFPAPITLCILDEMSSSRQDTSKTLAQFWSNQSCLGRHFNVLAGV